MRFLRWCGRAAVAVGQWVLVFFVLANLAQVLHGHAFVGLRIWAPLLGAFFGTAWLRRRLRARRSSKTVLKRGQEGVQE
jgi:hypothetical protein